MGRPEGIEAVLAAKFQVLLPHLDERQRRLAIGAEALSLGHGGIRLVTAAAGVREGTVSRGSAELSSGQALLGRVRRPGGCRKKAVDLDPGLRPALLALVEPDERGDPMSPLRWTTKSTRKLAAELTRQGHRVSADTVAGLLREEGFSLQANAKTIEGAQHPDRDAQFRYLNEQARDHRDAGDLLISVDSKKKELIGDYKNAGREWQPAGQPVRVKTHDFPGQAEKAIPYGIYDMTANTGWVSTGTDHDTAAFAVASIRRFPLAGECEGAGRGVQDGRAVLNDAKITHLLGGAHRTNSPLDRGTVVGGCQVSSELFPLRNSWAPRSRVCSFCWVVRLSSRTSSPPGSSVSERRAEGSRAGSSPSRRAMSSPSS